MDPYETIDVRQIPTSSRHDVLIKKIVDLKKNKGVCLQVDHDPKPLYYLLKAEYEFDFDWQYLQQGPEIWKVLVTKK